MHSRRIAHLIQLLKENSLGGELEKQTKKCHSESFEWHFHLFVEIGVRIQTKSSNSRSGWFEDSLFSVVLWTPFLP